MFVILCALNHTNPHLPPTLSSQTVKDVSRERFDVNCVPTDPSDCWCKIRASFLHAVLEHHPEISADEGGGGLLTRTESFARASGRKDGLCGPDSSTLCDTTVEEESAASGDAAAGNRVAPGGNGVNGEGKAGKGKVWGVGHECKGGMKGNRRASKSGLDMYLDQCAWRVLHAASRTASGGDCFFVVQVKMVVFCTIFITTVGVSLLVCLRSITWLSMMCPPSAPPCLLYWDLSIFV